MFRCTGCGCTNCVISPPGPAAMVACAECGLDHGRFADMEKVRPFLPRVPLDWAPIPLPLIAKGRGYLLRLQKSNSVELRCIATEAGPVWKWRQAQ